MKQRRRGSGVIAPRSSNNRVQPKWLPYADEMSRVLTEKPDTTLRELRDTRGGQEIHGNPSDRTVNRSGIGDVSFR